MKLNFCTLFNSSYLSRGMTLYDSLIEHCSDFHLYVYAFDADCYSYLSGENFKNLTVISLIEFENEDLLKVKKERTSAEYCWTCSSSSIHHAITNFNLDHCTYLDADMLFYSDPITLVEEMGNKSVLITEHRYSPEYDQSEVSGKYCVQFVTFKNNEQGMKVLNWWKDECIKWCYARVENGKFGDQRYLDEFETRFEGVHELQNPGGGLAPWNIQQYDFIREGTEITGVEIKTGKKFKPIFFHFHGLKFYDENIVCYTGEIYAINKQIMTCFYQPYIQLLNTQKEQIMKMTGGFDPHGNAGKSPFPPMNLRLWLYFLMVSIKQSIRNINIGYLKKRLTHHYYFYNRQR